MNLSQRKFLAQAFCLLLAGSLAGPCMGQIAGGKIELDTERETTRVLLRSGNATASKLLDASFTLHGGFQVVDEREEASFYVSLDPLGPSGARIVIASGIPEQVLFSETIPGQSALDALYRSIDRAMTRMRRTQGIFSGKLVFVREVDGASEACISDLLFQNPKQITDDGSVLVRPHWSPGGDEIVYTSYREGFPDIYRHSLAERRLDTIADFKGTNTGARYSPDGARLAMILSGGASANADLWIRDSDGRMRNLTASRGLEAAPDWSPDGSRLVFSSDQRGGPQLYVLPVQGGAMRRLRTDISGYCAEPDWNPAFPNLIAFTAAQGSGYQIAVFDSESGVSRWVSNEAGDAIEPHWLDDGRHLVFTHRRANRSEIKFLDTKTQRSHSLSVGFAKVSQASYVNPK